MIARLLRCTTLGLLAAALLWASLWWHRGRPVLALFGALTIALLHVIVLGLEFALLPLVNREDPAARADAARLVRAWAAEAWLAALVFGWRQPFRAARFPDRLRPDRRRGVVLVHGFFCNRGVWNPLLEHLGTRQVPFIAVDLDTAFGSIDDGVPVVEQAVDRLERVTGAPPVIIAHSMGGLVVRAWLDRHAADQRVRRIITLGTPHHGTLLARIVLGANVEQMRHAGGWLNRLRQREPACRAAHFTCFYSNCDNVVMPASTATLAGADNRHLPGIAHVEMIYRAEVLAELMRWLGDDPVSDSHATASSTAS